MEEDELNSCLETREKNSDLNFETVPELKRNMCLVQRTKVIKETFAGRITPKKNSVKLGTRPLKTKTSTLRR